MVLLIFVQMMIVRRSDGGRHLAAPAEEKVAHANLAEATLFTRSTPAWESRLTTARPAMPLS